MCEAQSDVDLRRRLCNAVCDVLSIRLTLRSAVVLPVRLSLRSKPFVTWTCGVKHETSRSGCPLMHRTLERRCVCRAVTQVRVDGAPPPACVITCARCLLFAGSLAGAEVQAAPVESYRFGGAPALINGRTNLSMSSSTPWSIGLMIRGIDARPAAVGDQRRMLAGLKRPATCTMRLITNPGIATEARPCQSTVSTASTIGLHPGGGIIERHPASAAT